MKFYHGSILENLLWIQAGSKSHHSGRKVAYFTSDRGNALLYCRRQEENFITAGIREDGKIHYFERFPDQLRKMYEGRTGYLYILNSQKDLTKTSDLIYESEKDVIFDEVERIEDVYQEILKEIHQGKMIFHAYEEIDPIEQKAMADHIKKVGMIEQPEMTDFYIRNFKEYWD